MHTNRKYVVAMAFLAVLAFAFGIVGTIAPPLAEGNAPIQPQQESSSDSVGHFQNPPTYDSGWVDIADKSGQSFTLTHDLNTRDCLVDVVGRQSLTGGDHKLFFGTTTYVQEWNRTYGGENYETPHYMIQTSDGGYALAGGTRSFGVGTPGFWNVYLVKTDSTGNLQWNKTYGGPDHDYAYWIAQTSDGGYALACEGGYADLVKTDSNGNEEWVKSYAGRARCVVQTSEGGYALAGINETSIGFWLAKIDPDGNMQWEKIYHNPVIPGGEVANSLVCTSDGGYALAGRSYSYDSGWDWWLVKTDSDGNHQWNKTWGGTGDDEAWCVIQTDDGGYALTGWIIPEGTSYADIWLVKTDSAGNQQWNRTYGGADDDDASQVVQTHDGGYAMAGETWSYSTDSDFLLVKTDSAGKLIWNKTYGGTNDDYGYSLVLTSDGGYALSGETWSYGAGNSDFWLVKTGTELGLSIGLSMTDFTDSAITFYRGSADPYWNYVRVRIWLIQEPSWMYGDINMDGVVDAKDLYILGRNYGKAFSLLSLTGIVAIAGVRAVKKRKQNKQTSSIS